MSAVVVPALCLVWFTGAAMRNERLASLQKLAEVYRTHLASAQARLAQRWNLLTEDLERVVAELPAPNAFAHGVRTGLVDSVLLFDEEGRLAYPHSAAPVPADFGALGALHPQWQEAGRLEQGQDYEAAARQYEALAPQAPSNTAAARALQAAARCFRRAGRTNDVLRLVDDLSRHDRYLQATDPHGRLIVPNAELMALELHPSRTSPPFSALARRLAARLADYQTHGLASPQRRFLLRRLDALAPGVVHLPLFEAEERAAELSATISLASIPGPDGVWQRSSSSNLWQLLTPNRRALALVRTEHLLTAAAESFAQEPAPADVHIRLAPPGAEVRDAFVTLPAGGPLPGWQLALAMKDQAWFDAAARRQTALYLWTTILVVAGMTVLALLALRLMRRQMRLARLKNDLAATVSHELTTPIASMRVLVETLLNAEKLDEPRTREYLHLIARENERLSRLIDSFLTFSRLERRRFSFRFAPLAPQQMLESAVEAIGERLGAARSRVRVELEADLPPILADPDALTTALINLLENACKYSDEPLPILLRAHARDGRVLFSVQDQGIGIAARERARIFQPFYQTDQRLSRRAGGCGLGLSIVQFIASAHQGNVSVESEPGSGSTFTVSLPAAPASAPRAESKRPSDLQEKTPA